MDILRSFCLITGLLLQVIVFAQRVEVLDSSTFQLGEGVILSKTSFRGLSVVNKNTIWVSGSRGTIARSIDGGKIFRFTQLKGYEKSDFRDIEAFDANNAIIMSSGSPAYILKTTDGGQSWKEVYKNTDTAYFLDAMDFWNKKRGAIIGDPVNGRFVLLKTKDGGETWKQTSVEHSPEAIPGEAVFAASGTSLRCLEKGEICFVTGGAYSRFVFKDECKQGTCWKYDTLPIIQGASGSGAFSVAVDHKFAIAAGGDYTRDTLVSINSAVSYNYRKRWHAPHSRDVEFKGYRSCIEIISNDLIVACGTSGVDFAKPLCLWGGRTQRVYTHSPEAFHVIRKAKKGKAVFFAGPKGKIGKLIY